MKLICPGCRKQIVVSTADDVKPENILPAQCVECGRMYTEKDQKAQLVKYADKKMKKLLDGLKF